MKEDLGDWLGALHGVHVGADEFLEELETGVLLCRHANAVHDLLAQRTATDAAAAARRRHDADDACKSCKPRSRRIHGGRNNRTVRAI